ncbi:hypothetical protein [Cereibacter sphaeroides]|uniref:hypothetical protein n=1 Tax=Cereibacter sphaeroides TaxID=1063 RepID=UPI00313B74B8
MALLSVASRPVPPCAAEDAVEMSTRAAVHEVVIAGLDLVEAALNGNLYPQAASLIRQEIETVEVVRGLRQKRQEKNRTPRLKALRHLGRDYKMLTDLAHVVGFDLLRHLALQEDGMVHFRRHKPMARHLLGLHIFALAGISLDVSHLRPFSPTSFLSPLEDELIAGVMGVLAAEGLAVVKWQAPPSRPDQIQ